MSVSVDDTGAQLPGDNEPETRATDAVRELKRGASCKEVLETLWPSDAVDYFRQVAELNPSHAPTQAFLARLEEANVEARAHTDHVQAHFLARADAVMLVGGRGRRDRSHRNL